MIASGGTAVAVSGSDPLAIGNGVFDVAAFVELRIIFLLRCKSSDDRTHSTSRARPSRQQCGGRRWKTPAAMFVLHQWKRKSSTVTEFAPTPLTPSNVIVSVPLMVTSVLPAL